MSETFLAERPSNRWESWVVFLAFLRLGLTSFGGPIAHLGYFRNEFVIRRRWLSDSTYADLVALCQFLPGPASSQVGMAIGLSRAGFIGAFSAWAGFTAPSALILILLATSISTGGNAIPAGLSHGLMVVAVAVVAQAVWGMGNNLCRGAARITIATLAACAVLLLPGAVCQLATIGIGGVLGLLVLKQVRNNSHEALPIVISKSVGVVALALFFALLIGLPFLRLLVPDHAMAMFDSFYRAGSLIFGGGHVMLPLLQAEVVTQGWVSNDTFLAGYGAAQAIPGPLSTFAGFLGASSRIAPNGWLGGMICVAAIFLPSFLLVVGALPFWEDLRRSVGAQAALAGINASVVGILVAALYQPIWRSSILTSTDFAMAIIAFAALMFWKLPPWLVVVGTGVIGWLLNFYGR